MAELTKQEVAQVFRRLRAIGPNKSCFDCGVQNPTWASVTFGVFVCIDCSAVHRSLGVHVSFIRSTQLDSWTWLQIRSMQLGGNAAATAYFRSHGCNAKESHTKYTSRAANMYREKIQTLAITAQKTYGNKLFIDTSDPQLSPTTTEDFFSSLTSETNESNSRNSDLSLDLARVSVSQPSPLKISDTNGSENSRQPSVDGLHSPSKPVQKPDGRSSLITKRKPTSKPGSGFGGGGGLGAQKLSRSFSEIEKQAEEKLQQDRHNQQQSLVIQDTRDTSKTSSQGYVGIDQKKMALLDPKKAKQAERLGIGFGRSGVSGSGHSASVCMDTIDQVAPIKTSYKDSRMYSQNRKQHVDMFDEYGLGDTSSSRYDPPDYSDHYEGSRYSSGSYEPRISSDSRLGKHSAFAPISQSTTTPDKPSVNTSTTTSSGNSYKNSGYRSNTQQQSKSSGNNDLQERFGNAKSISSDQYFRKDRTDNSSGEEGFSKFQGSKSISSDDYFGRTRKEPQNSGPDFSGFSESVSKVSSKIASAANGVWGSFQDHYN